MPATSPLGFDPCQRILSGDRGRGDTNKSQSGPDARDMSGNVRKIRMTQKDGLINPGCMYMDYTYLLSETNVVKMKRFSK